ncbi:MAG: MBL fold metallo-hydrolase [Treponema sp.]|jgi:glyoxylase-like metal-dependent hydrolase (beta-lactamase superfamily II)|nr:MBL fold metallo-hydrolase [Treponema sp.]
MELYQINRLVLGVFAVNCWIVVYGNGPAEKNSPRCLLIDPGSEPDRIIAQLERAALRPSHILLTHGHFDHTLALPDIHAAYPEAPIAIHQDDARYMDPEFLLSSCRGLDIDLDAPVFAGTRWREMPPPGLLLKDGDTAGPFTVLSVPGHTPGSVVFLLEEQKIMFSGDTLFKGDCGRVDLPGGNRRKIEESLKRLLALDGDIQVLPGHGESTSIAGERDTRFF